MNISKKILLGSFIGLAFASCADFSNSCFAISGFVFAKAENLVEEKIASIEAFREREKSEIHRVMIEYR